MRIFLPVLLAGCGTEHSLGSVVTDDQRPAPQVSCLDELGAVNTVVTLGEASRVQGAPDAAFDGTGMWVVYEEEGAILALHVRCDGEVDIENVRVADAGTEPSVAVSGQRMLFAWTVAEAVHTQVFAIQGFPAGDLIDHGALTGQPAVTALGEGGFALVAGRRYDDDDVQVFIQRMMNDGALDGDPIFVDADNGWLQYLPTVASYEGTIWAAWTAFSSGEKRVRRGTLFPGQERLSTVLTIDPSADRATGSAASGGAWFAYESEASGGIDVRVRATNGTALDLGEDGRDDRWPTVAAGEDGGAVAWVRDGTVRTVRFSGDGTVRQEQEGVLEGIEQDPLRLVRVADDLYWVAAVAGSPPRLSGQWIQF